MNSTEQIISKDLKTIKLICVTKDYELKEVTSGGRIWRKILSYFIGEDKAFADCKSQRVADVAALFLLERYSADMDLEKVSDFLMRFRDKVHKQENKEYVNDLNKMLEIFCTRPTTERIDEISNERIKEFAKEKKAHPTARLRSSPKIINLLSQI